MVFHVELLHASPIEGGDDVDVVEEEGLVEAVRIFEEKPGGFFQTAAGVEEDFFTRDFDTHAKVAVGFQIVDDRVGEVMDVDDDFVYTERAQAGEGDLEQGAAGAFDKSLGAIVGQGAEAGAEAGGQDHRFHWGAFMLGDNRLSKEKELTRSALRIERPQGTYIGDDKLPS